jgi:hypothetical protein
MDVDPDALDQAIGAWLAGQQRPPPTRPPPAPRPRRQAVAVDGKSLRGGHGRVEVRRLQVTTIAGRDVPRATQALRITRRVRPLAGRRWRTVTVDAVTSLTAARTSPARLADHVRGHWGIEALHHLRDVTFAEDACQVRTAPRAMASRAARRLKASGRAWRDPGRAW